MPRSGGTAERIRDRTEYRGCGDHQKPTATSMGKPRLKGITKRGNVYLRKLLIHGARPR
jgi:transposase